MCVCAHVRVCGAYTYVCHRMSVNARGQSSGECSLLLSVLEVKLRPTDLPTISSTPPISFLRGKIQNQEKPKQQELVFTKSQTWFLSPRTSECLYYHNTSCCVKQVLMSSPSVVPGEIPQ